ncbi:MAG TPA: lysozyme [Candidatus Competibacter sp.]|jgi:lysozyme|nr:lysozyme [Candidatus Competibacter sp.]
MTTQPARRRTDQPTDPARPTPPNRLTIGEAGLWIIRWFECFHPEPYLHRKGYHAIGYGHRIRDWGIVLVNPPIDRAFAETLLRREDLPMLQLYLNATTPVVLAQHEFDALCSLVFDVGIKAYERSPLRAEINQGHRAAAIAEFARFDALVLGQTPSRDTRLRRIAERTLFISPARP